LSETLTSARVIFFNDESSKVALLRKGLMGDAPPERRPSL
jgi:hypothetical protein